MNSLVTTLFFITGLLNPWCPCDHGEDDHDLPGTAHAPAGSCAHDADHDAPPGPAPSHQRSEHDAPRALSLPLTFKCDPGCATLPHDPFSHALDGAGISLARVTPLPSRFPPSVKDGRPAPPPGQWRPLLGVFTI